MALDAELLGLNSAGTYRFERDLSTISNDTTTYSNLRLVVGFSKTGPFNTPYLVTSQAEFIKLYGNIDRSLEKKGSYFHRSALVALTAGPILCMNLVNLDPDKDQVQTKSFSVNTTETNKPKVTLPVTAVYNTDKFWYADSESFLDGINTYLSDLTTIDENENQVTYTDSLLHFTNVGKKPLSILVKKASATASKGFELTLKEWYGEGNVPEYLNPTSYVSDYLVEVYVIAGDFGPETVSGNVTSSVNIDSDVDDDGDALNEVLTYYNETSEPYSKFSSDITYQDYFDEDGFIRRDNSLQSVDYRLNKFLNLSSVDLKAKYVGSLIPNFVDKLGKNIWIVKLVNDNTSSIGLLCTENVDLLEEVDTEADVINEKIDLLGHNIYARVVESGSFTNTTGLYKIDGLDLNFLSYKLDYTNILQTIKVLEYVEEDSTTTSSTSDFYNIVAASETSDSDSNIITWDSEEVPTVDEYPEGGIFYFTVDCGILPYEAGSTWVMTVVDGVARFDTYEESSDSSETPDFGESENSKTLVPVTRTYIKPKDSIGDLDYGNGLAPFAWYLYDEDTNSIYKNKVVYTTSSYITDALSTGAKVVYESPNGPSTEGATKYTITDYSDVNPLYIEYTTCDTAIDKLTGEEYVFYTSKTDDTAVYELKDNEVVLESGVVVGDYLVSYYNSGVIKDDDDNVVGSTSEPYSRVTRVVEVRNLYTKNSAGNLVKTHIRVICSDKIYKMRGENNNMVVKITSIDNICDRLQWTCLKGFTMRKDLCPDGTNDRQNEILDMLREHPWYTSTVSNLYKTLCDRDYIQWRYLIDTFGYGLEEECKNVYTLLCQGRKAALAIVNCPSQADFKKSLDPSFVNKSGGVSVEYIAAGGDQSKNPQFLFSLPTQDNGASWGAYYYPYLKISDLSAVKCVPPAAYVSNLYIQKYNRSNAWAIVAGQKRGVISGNQVIGVEATLVHENRDYLEPMGINSIIWENGVGVEIYANKTAKQTPKSALSSIHVREACIYIQDNIESILRKYVFEYNTAQTRLEIKTLVDDFLETVKNTNGVYDYKTVMDTTNNTSEIIDNNMGVIDVYIEPVRGLEILAQRLTVLKTGALESGNFE